MDGNKLTARASSNANTLFIGNLNKTWTKVCNASKQNYFVGCWLLCLGARDVNHTLTHSTSARFFFFFYGFSFADFLTFFCLVLGVWRHQWVCSMIARNKVILWVVGCAWVRGMCVSYTQLTPSRVRVSIFILLRIFLRVLVRIFFIFVLLRFLVCGTNQWVCSMITDRAI